MEMQSPFNRNGQMTLVPMPGFEELAKNVKGDIEARNPKKYQPTLVDIATPVFGRRASGEPFEQLAKDHIGGHDCFVITSGPGTPDMLVDTQILLGYLSRRRAARITLVCPYLFLTRSDKDEKDLELALLPHIIHMLASSAYGKLDRIVAADLHSTQEVMAGQMGLITEITLMRRILHKAIRSAQTEHPDKKLCLFFTDRGSCDRYELAVMKTCEEMNISIPVVWGRKKRISDHKSELVGLDGDLQAMRDALVLSVDDELATGGTNEHVARYIFANYTPSIYWAVIVHPVMCGEAASILANPSPISRVYTMDTIPVHNRPKLRSLVEQGRLFVTSWLPDLCDLAYFLHWDTSIRTLR